MKTKAEIATEAKELADVMASESGVAAGSNTFVGRSLRQLALMVHDLATEGEPASTAAVTKPIRRKK